MGEAEDGRRRSRPAWFVLLGVGLLAVLAAAWWLGTTPAVQVLAGLLVVVGFARAVLPEGSAGPLVVRSRAQDAGSCLVLAVLLLVVTTLVPTGA